MRQVSEAVLTLRFLLPTQESPVLVLQTVPPRRRRPALRVVHPGPLAVRQWRRGRRCIGGRVGHRHSLRRLPPRSPGRDAPQLARGRGFGGESPGLAPGGTRGLRPLGERGGRGVDRGETFS